jgi:AcrR family transcriptional regulator
MGRWKPDARGRMMRAALELYADRGFEQTTALDIAERAGVTERTFFRHFADKREVLFDGSQDLQARVLSAVAEAPAQQNPIEIAGAAMQAGAELIEGNLDYSRHRAAVIAANPSLQERELLKLSALAAAVTEALQGRGVPELAAGLAAETGVAVFKLGYEAWIRGDSPAGLAAAIRVALDQLKALTTQA